MLQLEKFLRDIPPPNVAIAEQIKVEVSNIPLALTYEDALCVANQICDLQAELELVNPAATLTLSEMVSKLVFKLRYSNFQMLLFQISEWEEKRLCCGVIDYWFRCNSCFRYGVLHGIGHFSSQWGCLIR